MKDLTQGRVGRHILELSTFIALSTFFQTLYFLADLYFVGRLGKEAIAGVGLGGNLMMVVLACLAGLALGLCFFALRGAYCRWLAADVVTAELGRQYLDWFIPALFLQFPLVGLGAAL